MKARTVISAINIAKVGVRIFLALVIVLANFEMSDAGKWSVNY